MDGFCHCGSPLMGNVCVGSGRAECYRGQGGRPRFRPGRVTNLIARDKVRLIRAVHALQSGDKDAALRVARIANALDACGRSTVSAASIDPSAALEVMGTGLGLIIVAGALRGAMRGAER